MNLEDISDEDHEADHLLSTIRYKNLDAAMVIEKLQKKLKDTELMFFK
jgi:hypothetical protein